MRLHSLRTADRAKSSIAALLLAFAMGGGALAEDGSTKAAGKTTTEVTTSQAELNVQTQVALSPDEQKAQAESIQRRGNQLAERMTRMLDEARRDKDILRANCVNRKLTEVNANVRNVEQRARALKDAAEAGDDNRRNHEYTVLTVLSEKLNMLNAEASQCLGQSVFEPGASQVVTTIPANAPTIDPTSVSAPSVAPPSVTVPPSLSPNM